MPRVEFETIVAKPVCSSDGTWHGDKIVGFRIVSMRLTGAEFEKWIEGKHPLQRALKRCPKCGFWNAKVRHRCLMCHADLPDPDPKYRATGKPIDIPLSRRNKKILSLLSQRPMTPFELAQHLGLRERTVEVELKYLAKLGFVILVEEDE